MPINQTNLFAIFKKNKAGEAVLVGPGKKFDKRWELLFYHAHPTDAGLVFHYSTSETDTSGRRYLDQSDSLYRAHVRTIYGRLACRDGVRIELPERALKVKVAKLPSEGKSAIELSWLEINALLKLCGEGFSDISVEAPLLNSAWKGFLFDVHSVGLFKSEIGALNLLERRGLVMSEEDSKDWVARKGFGRDRAEYRVPTSVGLIVSGASLTSILDFVSLHELTQDIQRYTLRHFGGSE